MRITKRPGGKECVVSDLNWHVLDPFGKKFVGHEKLDELIAEGFKFATKFKSDGEENVGVSGPIDLEAYKGCKFYSIAALVALDKDTQGATTLVLLENPDADDGSGYAIGLVSGNVVLDLTFKPSELDQIYSKFDEICSRVNREFVLSGDIAPIGREIDRHVTFKSFVEKKTAKKIPFTELKNTRAIALFAISCGLLVLILLGNFMWNYYKNSEREIAQRMEAMKNTPEYVYGEAAKIYVAGDFVQANKAIEPIAKSIGSLPVQVAGWQLEELKCGVASCLSTWKSKGGTYEGFQKDAPSEWKGFRYAKGDKDALGDLKSIYCDIPVVLPVSKLPLTSLWPKADELAFEIGKIWQSKASSGFTGSLKGVELMGVPPGLVSTTLAVVPNAVRGMAWEIRDQDWQTSKVLIAQYPDSLTLTDYGIRIDLVNKKVLFSANGVGYVQK